MDWTTDSLDLLAPVKCPYAHSSCFAAAGSMGMRTKNVVPSPNLLANVSEP